MRNDRFSWLGLALTAVLCSAGCSEQGGGDEGQPAPDFPAGSGQPEKGTAAYPAGPYGISPGSVIANYQFVGFANAAVVNDQLQIIQLADFYNPDGLQKFPEGSPYGAGEPKPKALLIDVASVWCAPCNYEAGSVLPGLYAQYQPQGGEFLLQLADGPTPGTAAESKHLYNWTTKYDVNYPATIDPTYKLSSLFESDAFPTNMIIKTSDMTIVKVIAGAPEPGTPAGDDFWGTFESVLNAQ
jgi:hypothetical protein